MFPYMYMLYIGLVSYDHVANVNALVTFQSNNVMPTLGNSLTLSCLIQDVVNDNSITWFGPKSIIGQANCFRQSRFCTGSTPGYTYTANQSGAHLDISNIKRDQDEGTWKCSYRGSDGMDTVRTLNITVYNVNALVTLQCNNVMPTSGNSLILSCLIQDVVNDNTIVWNKPKSNTDVVCLRQSRLCFGSPEGYSYIANDSGAYLDITRINRDQDEGTWKCSYRGSDGLDTVRTLNITVYTLPSQLVYTKDVQAPMDLSMSNLTLQCKTSGCTYPAPFIKWYYKTQTSPVVSGLYPVVIGMTSSDGSCPSQEKLYTSTLQIPLYTTWSDNSDKIVTFYCGTEYPDSSRNIQSTDSGTVRFAVAVTSVTLSISASEVVFYEGYQQMLTCISSPSRPISTIRWFLGSRLLTDNITTTDTIDTTGLYILTSQIFLTLMRNGSNQQIKCEGFIGGQQPVTSMEKPSVNVWYKPSKPLVREYGGANSGFPWLENMTGTLQCYSSDYGNPGANVTWFNDQVVMDKMNILVITGLMPNDDKREVSCKLVNRFTLDKNIEVLSNPLMLNVEYYPIIKYNASFHLLVNESQSISVHCEAVGNPNPLHIQWRNQLNGSTLKFENISRIHKGTYTCEATALSNKYGILTGQKQLDIIVQYAPDIKVTLTGSNQQNQTAVLICEAQGVPAQYTFKAWVHMWEDMVIRTELQGTTSASQSILTIDRLSLESMGTYICSANNGITGLNGNINQTGSRNLTITGKPNILDDSAIFFGEIGMSVNISIPFYSNPVIESFVIQRNGTEIINNSRTMTFLTWDLVSYEFYGNIVQLKAQKAYFYIQSLIVRDFDSYTLELKNSIGKADVRFQLEAFGPPHTVHQFYFNRFIDNQVELHFYPGFNGGLSQTFVIEESAADSNGIWQNTSVTNLLETERQNQFKNGTFFVNTTMPVIPGIYQYRMYSWNIKGKSEFSKIITVTIPGAPNAYESSESSVAGVAGGISAGIVIILAVVIGIFLWRRNRCKKQNEHDKDIERNHELSTRKNQTSTNSLKQDVASGKDYEGLHFSDAEANQYLELNGITSENTENSDKRSPESDSYEKLQPYANSDIQMYSSLKIPVKKKDFQKDYENTWIKT